MSPEQFLKEFGHLAETEGGVGQLRGLVVEMAVAGRLEGCRFTCSPVALKDAVATIQTGPFGSLLHQSDYVSGGTPLINPINIVRGRIIPDPAKAVSNKTLERLSLYCVAVGDVMLARRGEMGRAAVVTSQENGWLCGTGSMFLRPPLTLSPEYLALWLGSPGVRSRLSGDAVGSTMSNLNQRILAALKIAVPSLPEQKRIIEKVDQLMALCDELEAKQKQKREKAIAFNQAALNAVVHASDKAALASSWSRLQDHFEVLYELPENVKQLRQTILQLAVMGKLVRQEANSGSAETVLSQIYEAYTTGVDGGFIRKPRVEDEALPPIEPLPSGWAWTSIGRTFDVGGGIQKTPKRRPVKHHFPYLRVENVQRGRLDLSRLERYELQEGELERWALTRGDLLVVEGNGSEKEIGRCAIWDGSVENCVHQNHLIRCRPVHHDASAFVMLYLNSPAGVERMKQLAVTTSGLYNLSVGKIRSIAYPFPPVAEQHRIVGRVEQFTAMLDDLDMGLTRRRERGGHLMQAVVERLIA